MSDHEPDDYDHVVCRHCGKAYGAVTATHLRRWHEYTGEHPVRDYKELFSLPTASSADARERLKEHRIEYWDARGQHWTRDKILGAIRRRYQAGQSLRVCHVPNRLLLAAARCFGSWELALRMACLDYDRITGRRHWTRDKVIAEIRKLEADRVPLNSTSIERTHGDLYRAAINLYPSSWEKALRAAGLRPAEHKKRRGRWNHATAKTWAQQRIAKGRSLLAGNAPVDLQRFVRDSMKMSWTEFIESFGIAYPGIKKRRDWTRQKLLEEIRRLAAEGRPTNLKAVAHESQALIKQARKYYGSWDRARAAAGVAIERVFRVPWTKESLLREVKLWASRGQPMNARDVRAANPSLYKGAERLFGTWSAACDAAGVAAQRLRPGGPEKWTNEMVLAAIRARTAEGRAMNSGAVGKDHEALLRQGSKRFGSWDAACIAAGIGVQRLRPPGRKRLAAR